MTTTNIEPISKAGACSAASTPVATPTNDDIQLLYELDRRHRRCASAKTVIVAVCLLVMGIACFVAAFFALSTGGEQIGILFLLGTLLIIPGSYQSFILFQAWLGRPGFNITQVPDYNI